MKQLNILLTGFYFNKLDRDADIMNERTIGDKIFSRIANKKYEYYDILSFHATEKENRVIKNLGYTYSCVQIFSLIDLTKEYNKSKNIKMESSNLTIITEDYFIFKEDEFHMKFTAHNKGTLLIAEKVNLLTNKKLDTTFQFIGQQKIDFGYQFDLR